MATAMTKAEWVAAMKLWQVPVLYYPGWDTRGRPGDFAVMNGVFIHHTGSDAGQSDDYLAFLFKTGRPADGIPGPLCHSAADMDGDLHMGAIGRANHAGRGSSGTLAHTVNEDYAGFLHELKPGADNTDGNAHYYGCEVRYDGGQPMTPKQYAAATRWAAAICHHYGWSALSVIGHREWTTRKNDPGNCPMNKFRSDVAALLKAGPPKPPATTPGDTPTTPKDWDEMATEAQVEAAAYRANSRYAKDFWTSAPGTGTALIKAIAANGAAIGELAKLVQAEDVADDAAFAAAMAEIKAANTGLQAAVDELAAAVTEPPKA